MAKLEKKIAKKIWKTIDSSQNILLHLHPSPDGDCTGAALSFYHILKQLNKTVTLIGGDSEFPSYLCSLPGTEFIIPKNYFQVDLSLYDLFIMVDAASENQISKMGQVIFPSNLKTIVVDHHDTNNHFADINLVDSNYGSTCQLLYDLYKFRKGIKIDGLVAANILIGMYTDTGGFKYSKTTSKTFDIASKLSKIYPDFHKIIFNIENNEQSEHLSFLSLALSNIETFYKNRVAISIIPYQKLVDADLIHSSWETSEIANKLKSVTGWDIGICFLEYQPNMVKVSFRTRNSEKYDLSAIAAATKFGGGSKAAAGATIKLPFSEAKQLLLDTIISLYPELNK